MYSPIVPVPLDSKLIQDPLRRTRGHFGESGGHNVVLRKTHSAMITHQTKPGYARVVDSAV